MATNRRQRRTAAKRRTPGADANLIALAKRHHSAGNFSAAKSSYAEALKINKKNTDALIGLALIKLKEDDRRGALSLLKKAVRIDPQLSVARFMLGSALLDEGAFDDAIQQYRQCVSLEPENMQYLRRLGDMWTVVEDHSKAAECYERIIAAEPDNAEVHNNLGMMYLKLNLFGEAIGSLRRAIELHPTNTVWRSNFLLSLNYFPGLSPQRIFEEHRDVGGEFSRSVSQMSRSEAPVTTPSRRLKIGFVSPDFRTHSVSYFLEPLLAELDRDALEVFCYAEVKHPDNTTARLQSLTDNWHSTIHDSDEKMAARIRGDGIDILVDLAGHTVSNRLGVFANRAAPVQVTWLGYPNTTGVPAMDFRITDAVCDPEGTADEFATESLIRLPDSFLCYRADQNAPEIVASPCLSEDFVTFGSFNNPSKINEEIVALWAAIMRCVPGSRFLMKYGGLQDTVMQNRIEKWFANNGIDRTSLIFLGRSESQAEHLGHYGRIDVALDTHPYNGTTTTCEALWMGVPVVSLIGDRHASRVGASLLNQIEMPDLAAADEKEYIAIASGLAGNRDRLTELRYSLRGRMRASKLMDEKNFARQMGAAFDRMLQIKSASRLSV